MNPHPMKRILLLLLPALLLGCPATEQATQSKASYSSANTPRWEPDNRVYDPNIRTVQLYQGQYEQAFPVLYLGETRPLTLEFDELIPEDRRETDYSIDIVNCDANWNPSTLLPIEFFEGFTQKRVDFYERSRFTKATYVHYWHQFPLENEFFKMSGNYLLKVFRNNDPRDVVITSRFVVADRKLGLELKYLLNSRVDRIRMESFAFDLLTAGTPINVPAFDLTVTVLQNFRWDNALLLNRPRFFGDNRYEYTVRTNSDYLGGNEFRRLDLRSVRLFSEAVQDVQEGEELYEVELFADTPRPMNVFSSQRDRNGMYHIEVFDWPEFDTQAEYLWVHFKLKMPAPVESGEVYVFGALSDWQALPDFQMEYRADLGYYECFALMKQGLYDFQYVVKRPDGSIDDATLEGRHTETENFYTLLVYYRSPSDRSHQLIGFMPVNYYE